MLAESKLKIIEDKKEYGNTLMLLSIAYEEKNNLKEALNYAKKARKVFDEIENLKEIANMETNLGVIFAKGNNFEESFEHLNKALKIKIESNDSTIADTVFKICNNYMALNQYDKAAELINDLFEKLGDNQINYRIKYYEYMFDIYKKQGDFKKSEEILLGLIKYLEKLDNKLQLADYYIKLGRFYNELQEKDLSLLYINKGIEIYEDYGIILNK